MEMKELKKIMSESGYTRNYIAGWLGLSVAGMNKKLNGTTEFNADEMEKLIRLFKLKYKEIKRIFLYKREDAE